MANTGPSLHGRPDRIFVSVDTSTGTSTISFAPADVGAPFQHTEDADGARAMADARAILVRYPTATIHGPHFHAAASMKQRQRRRPS